MASQKNVRISSFARLSISLRMAFGDKKLGYKGEVSKEAKQLETQLRLVRADFGDLTIKSNATRREGMASLVEEISFLYEHCDSTEKVFTAILESCKRSLSNERFDSVTSAPVKQRQTDGLTEQRKSTGVRSYPVEKKKTGSRRHRVKRGKSSKFEFDSGRNSSFSISREVSTARKFELINIIPLETYLKELNELKLAIETLLRNVREDSNDLQVRLKQKGSVSGVYNPLKGKVEWRESIGGGICGVWNARLQVIEWKEKKGFGVHGVYNPLTGAVEWKFFRNGGVYGVWDPNKRVVRWKQSYREGVCGVWHPVFESVVFKTFRNGGVVGWFDEEVQDIKWRSKKDHGVCVIRRTQEDVVYESITSSYCGWLVR